MESICALIVESNPKLACQAGGSKYRGVSVTARLGLGPVLFLFSFLRDVYGIFDEDGTKGNYAALTTASERRKYPRRSRGQWERRAGMYYISGAVTQRSAKWPHHTYRCGCLNEILT